MKLPTISHEALVHLTSNLGLSVVLAILAARGTAHSSFVSAAWLCVPILVTSILASSLAVVIVSSICCAVLWAMPAVVSNLNAADRIPPIALIVIFAVVTAVSSHYRAMLEGLRNRELRQHCIDLEGRYKSLEAAVRARTRDLEASHAALTTTRETLRRSRHTLVATARMATLGRLAAGCAHEMSSPLAAVLASLMTLDELVDEYTRLIGSPETTVDDQREIAKELRESVDLAQQGTERAAKFLRGLKAQTRTSGPCIAERFDVIDVVMESTTLLAHAARAVHCRIDVGHPRSPLGILGDPHRLAQALTNLLQNAVETTGDDRGDCVRVSVLPREGGGARIEVRDDGPGISEEMQSRLFEPLQTTKIPGVGNGLCLVIAKEIVETDLHGTVTVDSTPGAGATFVIEIPDRPTAT